MPADDRPDLLCIAEGLQAMEEADWTPAQRTFALVWELESEVNNGGFHQYFFNSSGRHGPDAAAVLEQIGAANCAELARRATDLVGPDFPWPDIRLRRQALRTAPGQLEADLDALDTAFYAYPDDLAALLGSYAARHPTDFATL
jgi:hypothetical protein